MQQLQEQLALVVDPDMQVTRVSLLQPWVASAIVDGYCA